MGSRLWLNFGLLLLLSGLALTAMLSVREEAKGTQWLGLSPLAVKRIEITPRDGETVLLAREGLRWQLLRPRELPASGYHVKWLLDVLQSEPNASYAVAEVNLAELGLDAPVLRARFNDTEVTFGGRAPLNDQRYARHGDTVVLLDDTFVPLARSPWWNWIARDLVSADRVESATLDGAALDLAAFREAWAVVEVKQVKPLDDTAADGRSLLLQTESTVYRFVLPDSGAPRLLRPDQSLVYLLDKPLTLPAP